MKTEDRLQSIARNLGEEAAVSFDAEASAQRVVARLRAERSPLVRITRIAISVAAVAVIAIGIGVVARLPGTDAPVAMVPAELVDLTEDELTEVIDSLVIDEPVYELAASDIYALDEDELAQLLELMES